MQNILHEELLVFFKKIYCAIVATMHRCKALLFLIKTINIKNLLEHKESTSLPTTYEKQDGSIASFSCVDILLMISFGDQLPSQKINIFFNQVHISKLLLQVCFKCNGLKSVCTKEL